MTQVTYARLNIGRNVGFEPMDDKQWEWFISTAQSVLMGAQHRVPVTNGNAQRDHVQVHRGTGYWGGLPEESAHVSLYWDRGMDADYITEQAGVMARMFDQDAIAVILGSTLITADAGTGAGYAFAVELVDNATTASFATEAEARAYMADLAIGTVCKLIRL